MTTWSRWTEKDCATATRIYEAHRHRGQMAAFAAVATALKRNPPAVAARYYNFGDFRFHACTPPAPPIAQHPVASRQAPNTGSFRAPDHVLAERDARAAARYLRSPTQEFFGDPPPGYSMLDRRRS